MLDEATELLNHVDRIDAKDFWEAKKIAHGPLNMKNSFFYLFSGRIITFFSFIYELIDKIIVFSKFVRRKKEVSEIYVIKAKKVKIFICLALS